MVHCFGERPTSLKIFNESTFTTPLAPTSIVFSTVVQPLLRVSETKLEYLDDFAIFHLAILSSNGEVNSKNKHFLADRL